MSDSGRGVVVGQSDRMWKTSRGNIRLCLVGMSEAICFAAQDIRFILPQRHFIEKHAVHWFCRGTHRFATICPPL